MSMVTTMETTMKVTRLMDVIIKEPNGSYCRDVHAFETAAQVDSMRDMLMAQGQPATWYVLGAMPTLGKWEVLYSGASRWELADARAAMQQLDVV